MDALLPRLALARGWITPEVEQRIVARLDSEPSCDVEDLLREAGLSADQIRTLRGALGHRSGPGSPAMMGEWQLLRRLGVGGMGSVFEARHTRTSRRAALKVLSPRLGRDPKFSEQFLREARALARIEHGNIPRAFDVGRHGELLYLAMELVEGEDLRQRLDRQGSLSPRESAQIALDVARALDAMHRAGLVHRDVKPANVLLDRRGGVKLVDFGLSFDPGQPKEIREGIIFGTPSYMSPEQARGELALDCRSDLYSLGATWHHALLGRPPHRVSSPGEALRKMEEEAIVPPREIRQDVPLAIDRLLMNLLEKDPDRRPRTPAVVISALESVLAEPDGERRSLGDGAHAQARFTFRGLLAVAVALAFATSGVLWFDAWARKRGASSPAVHVVSTVAATAPLASPLSPAETLEAEPAGGAEFRMPVAVEPLEAAGKAIAAALDYYRGGAFSAFDPPSSLSPALASGAAAAVASSVESAAAARTRARILEEREEERALGEELAMGQWASATARVRRLLKPAEEGEPEEGFAILRRTDLEALGGRIERVSFAAQRFFHGPARLVEPSVRDALSVRYPFDSEDELHDFRFSRALWVLAEGRLERVLGAGDRKPRVGLGTVSDELDSIALWAPPLVMRGRWVSRRGATSFLAVAHGDRWVALSQTGILEVWRGGVESGPTVAADPKAKDEPPSAALVVAFTITMQVEGCSVRLGDAPARDAQFPEHVIALARAPGRLVLLLGAGDAIEDLEVVAELDPVWSVARQAALSAAEADNSAHPKR